MKTLLLAFASLAACSLAFGFSVNPMMAELDPNGARSNQIFVLSNTSDEDKPIEISVGKPYFDEAGVERLTENEGEELFLIVPQQLVLPANSRRSVKVFYVGDPMDEEDTYRILFKQVPVNLPTSDDSAVAENEARFDMKVVLQYHTRIWLTPSDLSEQLEIAGFALENVPAPASQSVGEPAAAEPFAPMLRLTVANTGSCHGYIRQPQLLIATRDGKTKRIQKDELRGIAGQVVLKESSKDFRLAWNGGFPPIETIESIRLKVEDE